jgi:hypothetical protein
LGVGVTSPYESLSVFGNMSLSNVGKVVLYTSNNYLGLASQYDQSNAPYMMIMGKQVNSNLTSGSFGGNMALAKHHTSNFVLSNMVLGRLAFGGNYTDSNSNVKFPVSIAAIANSNFTTSNIMSTSLVFCTGNVGTDISDSNTNLIGTERMRVNTIGYIGIGTSNPSFRMDITHSNVTDMSAIVRMSACNVGTIFSMGDVVSRYNGLVKLGDSMIVSYSNVNDAGGGLVLGPWTTATNKGIRIDGSTGFVGIGKSNPTVMLDVNGTVNASSLLINGSALSTNVGGGFTAAATNNTYTMCNVGIGTVPNASYKLDVSGNAMIRVNADRTLQITDGTSAISITGHDNGTSGGVLRKLSFVGQTMDFSTGSGVSTTAMTVYSTQANGSDAKVGIRTATPQYTLDVNGTLNATNLLINGSALSTTTGGGFTAAATNVAYTMCNVGVGTSSPGYGIDVRGSIAASNYIINGTITAVPSVGLNGGNGDKLIMWPGTVSTYPYSIGIGGYTLWYSVPAAAQHMWYTGGSAGMTLSNNLLGVGTTNPSANLHVSKSTNGNAVVRIENATGGGDTSGGQIDFASTFTSLAHPNDLCCSLIGEPDSTSGGRLKILTSSTTGVMTNAVWIDALQRVAINGTAPSYTLHVTGNIYASADITAFSDARKKTNVEVINDALTKLDNVSGYTFNMLEDTNNSECVHKSDRYAGVLAQEIEKVLPEVVYEDKEGYKSVAYGNLTALLIQAVKELKQKCETLEQRIATLESTQ